MTPLLTRYDLVTSQVPRIIAPMMALFTKMMQLKAVRTYHMARTRTRTLNLNLNLTLALTLALTRPLIQTRTGTRTRTLTLTVTQA